MESEVRTNEETLKEMAKLGGATLLDPALGTGAIIKERRETMSGAQAVRLLMEMMNKTKDEFECEALHMACRNIVKRWSDHHKHWARKNFAKGQEL